MKREVLMLGCLLMIGRLAWAADPVPQAETLLKQIDAMQPPTLDQAKREDSKYIESYIRQMQEYEQKRNESIKDFFTRFPQHARAVSLISEAWIRQAQRGQRQQVLDETAPVLARTTNPKHRIEILYVRALATVMLGRADQSAPVVAEFIQAAPQDERGGALLVSLGQTEHNPAKKAEYLQSAADRFPTTMYGRMAKGILRQLEGVGKPLELTFTDAITGKQISVQKDLRGKVVVIDFWATWCGPCVAEMPELKKLYAEYKDKGVEFIGVSLDAPEAQGGLTKLKEFVRTNEIAWPQYYQADAWTSEFSSSWGISGIPTAFIVDKQGNLASTEARGQLQTMILQLLDGRSLQARHAAEPHH